MNKNRAAEATDFEYLLYKTLGKKYLVVKSYFFGTLGKVQWRRLSDQSSSGVLLVENVVSEKNHDKNVSGATQNIVLLLVLKSVIKLRYFNCYC